MADFEIAFDETMQFEGGYANDPDDRGGETYRGISRRYHPDWPGWSEVDEVKRRWPDDFRSRLDQSADLDPLIKSFYREHFWSPLAGDQLSDQHLANELFDTGVNQGVATAVRYLQESLNLLSRRRAIDDDLAVDGVMGERTLGALAEHLETDRGSGEALLKLLNLFQGLRYIERARKDLSQRKFIRGWLKRVGLH
jgi:lysozyme family protein